MIPTQMLARWYSVLQVSMLNLERLIRPISSPLPIKSHQEWYGYEININIAPDRTLHQGTLVHKVDIFIHILWYSEHAMNKSILHKFKQTCVYQLAFNTIHNLHLSRRNTFLVLMSSIVTWPVEISLLGRESCWKSQTLACHVRLAQMRSMLRAARAVFPGNGWPLSPLWIESLPPILMFGPMELPSGK